MVAGDNADKYVYQRQVNYEVPETGTTGTAYTTVGGERQNERTPPNYQLHRDRRRTGFVRFAPGGETQGNFPETSGQFHGSSWIQKKDRLRAAWMDKQGGEQIGNCGM